MSFEAMREEFSTRIDDWAASRGISNVYEENVRGALPAPTSDSVVVSWALGALRSEHLTFSERVYCGNLGITLAAPSGSGTERMLEHFEALGESIDEWGGDDRYELGISFDDLPAPVLEYGIAEGEQVGETGKESWYTRGLVVEIVWYDNGG